ncbi:MAG: hypothetical protein E7415_05905 [Ruminococcaceae bacterium]|nr:hypothetical protein [Oscillospiraceae bacterium]
MSDLKCKYRGGEIVLNNNEHTGKCQSCGAVVPFSALAIEEKKKKSIKKIKIFSIITSALLLLAIGGHFLTTKVIIPKREYNLAMEKYNLAVEYMEKGEYEKALATFNQLNGFEDSEEKIKETNDLIYKRKINMLAEKREELKKYSNLISAGSSHTVGLKYDGTAVAAGSNISGFIPGSDGPIYVIDNENGYCNVEDWDLF